MKLNIKRLFEFLLVAALTNSAAVSAAQTVVPSTNLPLEGNSSDGGIFGEGGGGDFRMQGVYASTEFSSHDRPFFITGITFRPDASPLGGADSSGWRISPISVNLLIRLSTTSKPVDGLSFTFAENIGLDQTTVLNGFVPVSSSNSLIPGGTTKLFDVRVDFTTPFLYDPRLGNLLLDTRTIAGGDRRGHTIDGVSTLGDAVSSVRTAFGNGGSAAAANGDTYGTIVQFTISPVPESSTLAFMALGLAGIFAIRRRNSP